MQYSTVALLAFVAAASAQSPPGCVSSQSGTFQISPVNITSSSKRDLNIFKRQSEQACDSTPIITLSNGKLTDQDGRTGEIVSNEQFQFDNPTQSGALFTSGWSICSNGTLSIGGSSVFYSCNSGSFNNLYHESVGAQCFPVFIDTIPCVGPSGSASAAPVTSSTPSSTPAASSSPVASSTPVTTSAPVVSSVPTTMAPITMTAPAPFPVAANSTTAATGTAVASTAPTKATTSAPATFTAGSGANMLAAGSKLFAGMVGLVAFAML
ncbi:hypothetical protein JMJ35_007032 [Cladonia borealis]|uniref:Cell wall mannoprotein PIR1-like C-terminal domain-containing protein n=1 Tax=Cladonia borealis TaxID=184061 RepID=A0AA39V7M9_9LECA|nr:hypothetical protein JMJ35_007032 [Cladonia borealis]